MAARQLITPNLTDREKEQLKEMIDAGQALPPRYKAVLFDQPHDPHPSSRRNQKDRELPRF
jgi:hypothetical protein